MAAPNGTSLDDLPSAQHAVFCFDVLLHALDKTHSIVHDSKLQLPGGDMDFPLFVTWKKLHRGETYHLRGCIGTFSPLQLQDGLREYSLISALRDSRFDPVELDEVPQLQVGISLLMHFEDGADWQDWTVGKHGISIKFSSARGKRFSATYLPEVASEQGWDVPETLESLVRKAGYRGPVNAQLLESIKLTRYQSQKTSLTYAEYQEARKALLAG